MERIKRIGLFILLLGAIPMIGLIASIIITSDIDAKYTTEGLPPLSTICGIRGTLPELRNNSDIIAACSEFDNIALLGDASAAVLFCSFLLPLIYLAVSFIGRGRRTFLSFAFPLLVPITIIVLSVSVLVQSGIFAYSVYIAESYFTGYIHPKLVFVIGLVGVLGALSLIQKLFIFFKPQEMTVIGQLLDYDTKLRLQEIVASVCKELGTARPSNVVVGLEPTFYATNCKMHVIGNQTKLRGNTLYVSALLLRFLSDEETSAVIGHEMGHFCGKDTAYTLRFAPVYASLSKSIASLSGAGQGNIGDISKLPALATLVMMLEIFSKLENEISRTRELEADKAGASVGSPKALITALIKTTLISGYWPDVRKKNAELLSEGRVITNLCGFYNTLVKNIFSEASKESLLQILAHQKISHPTDSHPTLQERANGVAIDLSEALTEVMNSFVATNQDNSENLILPEQLEEELTITEHRVMIAIGAAKLPEDMPSQETEQSAA